MSNALAHAKHWKFNTRWDDPSLDWETKSTSRSAMLDIGDEDDPDRPIVIVVEYPANRVVPPHHHETDYLSVIVQGEMKVTGRAHDVGSMRFTGAGTVYGPLEIGPAGCTVIDIFINRSGCIPVFPAREGVSPEEHEARRAKLRERMDSTPRRRS